MHKESKEFLESVKEKFPEYFEESRVLDIGSCDINGNNSYLFGGCDYLGLDLAPGPNVNIVCKTGDFRPDQFFDVVISTNTFEHDKEWARSIRNIVLRILRKGGLFVFSCSGPGTLEHGTVNASPEASLSSAVWGDYYRNLTETDIRNVLNIEELFNPYNFHIKIRRKGMGTDLQFWGILL